MTLNDNIVAICFSRECYSFQTELAAFWIGNMALRLSWGSD